jgi:serine/threonine protein phosphatase 1
MRWVIGDIHGCAKPLDRLIDAVNQRDGDARFLFVGDYVNRGPDSAGVVERLLRLPNARFCRGNHDNIWDLLLNRTCYDVRNDFMHAHAVFSQFLDAGLDRTLLSYGIEMAAVYRLAVDWSIRGLADLLAPVPQTHRDFIRQLEPVIEFPDAFVAHARWPSDQPDGPAFLVELLMGNQNLRQELIWGRFKRIEIEQPKPWRRRGFFGHTPVSFYHYKNNGLVRPIVGEKVVLLDTAIALGLDGRLTAYCIETDRCVQVDRGLDVVELPSGA